MITLVQGSTTVAEPQTTAKEAVKPAAPVAAPVRDSKKPMPELISPIAKGLTATEHYIYNALTDGLSVAAISARQGITEKTVKFHSTRIYKKLKVKGVKELMALEIKYYRSLQNGT